MTSIGAGSSGVLGSHAVISSDAAGPLLRLLGDWSREFLRLGVHASAWNTVDEAVTALQLAASRAGSGEGAGKLPCPTMDAWITTAQVARLAGRSSRWIRVLHEAGRIDGEKVAGRLMFPPSTPDQVRALAPVL